MNFFVETERALREAGKTSGEVLWVGSLDGLYAMSWEEFARLTDFEYFRFGGRDVVATDLVIVGHDWWMERATVEGLYLWELRRYPRRRGHGLPFRELLGIRGTAATTLRKLNPDPLGVARGEE